MLNFFSRVRFISFEPLLEPLGEIDLTSIDWVIVGGESGPGARPMEQAWVVEIREQRLDAGVPFFFKQWGGVNKKKAGRLLEGRTREGFPLTDISARRRRLGVRRHAAALCALAPNAKNHPPP